MLASILLFFDVSGGEIVVIMLFVLIFFGSKKIPELARGLGKGMREFQDASNSIRREIQSEAGKFKDEVSKVQSDIRSEVKPDSLDAIIQEFTISEKEPTQQNLPNTVSISSSGIGQAPAVIPEEVSKTPADTQSSDTKNQAQ